MNSETVDRIAEGFLFSVFVFLSIGLLVGIIAFVVHCITYDPVRAEKEKVYMAVCQSMSGVYIQSSDKNMCFKEGKLIQIDE